MTAVAPHLTAFLREHLPKERRASPHTCEAYADSFRILLGFAAHRLGIRPYRLEVEQLDAPLILAFLEQRSCSPSVMERLTGFGDLPHQNWGCLAIVRA